ncbi:MAG: T9SS type A sorting domain-containing protein, partial [Ignavibacteriaceae bacterium]
QNWPNPFNSSSVIRYAVPQSSNVIIKVYDILGNEIETLVNEEKPVGTYEITWTAVNLPSGAYFYQLKADDFIQTKKMMLIK